MAYFKRYSQISIDQKINVKQNVINWQLSQLGKVVKEYHVMRQITLRDDLCMPILIESPFKYLKTK